MKSDTTLQFEMFEVTERGEASETRNEGNKLPQKDNSVETLEREFYSEIDIVVQKGNEMNYSWVNHGESRSLQIEIY